MVVRRNSLYQVFFEKYNQCLELVQDLYKKKLKMASNKWDNVTSVLY